MSIRKYISFVLFVLGSIVCNAQLDTTHRLISTSGSIYDNPNAPVNEPSNISWTIGEVFVLKQDTITRYGSSLVFVQGMQSYPFVPKKDCPKVTLSSNNINLCETNSFATKLSFSYDSLNYTLESLQWYFKDAGNDTSKIVGQTNINSRSYTPYFPGLYSVKLKFKGLSCESYSTSLPVQTLTNPIIPPQISPTGSPISLLTVAASNAALQWYVFVTSLNKYLMIAGGNKASQKVRYNGDYMVIATYTGGCRLSSTFGVTGHAQAIQRTTDFRIEGNTIYIPDEEAPEHSALSVYPNPTLGDFVVRFQSTDEITANAQLYSNTGVFVKEIVFTEGSAWSKQAKVETDDLSAGVYFLKVNQDNKHLVQKVVIYK